VLHLWHPQNDRSQLNANQARLDEVLHGSRTRALRGMSTLAADDGAQVRHDTAMAQR
jgi:hypothetical protein